MPLLYIYLFSRTQTQRDVDKGNLSLAPKHHFYPFPSHHQSMASHALDSTPATANEAPPPGSSPNALDPSSPDYVSPARQSRYSTPSDLRGTSIALLSTEARAKPGTELLSSRRTSSGTWTLTPGAPWPWFPAAPHHSSHSIVNTYISYIIWMPEPTFRHQRMEVRTTPSVPRTKLITL